MNTSTPPACILLDQDLGTRLYRAVFRTDPPPETAAYLTEWPHAIRGSGTARRRCDHLRDAVTPQGLVVAALIGSMCDPSTYWPDIDLARVRVETTAAFC